MKSKLDISHWAICTDSSPCNATGTGDKYQEAGLHSIEQGTLHVHSCHYRLADHVQAVTYCTCLFQPVAPAQSALLQRCEGCLVHWQHTMQVSLQHRRYSASTCDGRGDNHYTLQRREEKRREEKRREEKRREEKRREEKRREEKRREEKRREDHTFWCQFNEKPSIILGCPGPANAKCARRWGCLTRTHTSLLRHKATAMGLWHAATQGTTVHGCWVHAARICYMLI